MSNLLCEHGLFRVTCPKSHPTPTPGPPTSSASSEWAPGACTPFKARKKPVTIQAMRHDGTIDSSQAIIAWANDSDSHIVYGGVQDNEVVVEIATLEGKMTARPGDYVIRGVKGEFYPCKPDIFAATYDPVPPEPTP